MRMGISTYAYCSCQTAWIPAPTGAFVEIRRKTIYRRWPLYSRSCGSIQRQLRLIDPRVRSHLLAFLRILLLYRGRRAFDRQYLWFYILVGAWLLGTIVADEYNAIGFFNRAKGTARVVFFALDFMALAILLKIRSQDSDLCAEYRRVECLRVAAVSNHRNSVEIRPQRGPCHRGLAGLLLLLCPAKIRHLHLDLYRPGGAESQVWLPFPTWCSFHLSGAHFTVH